MKLLMQGMDKPRPAIVFNSISIFETLQTVGIRLSATIQSLKMKKKTLK